jgi:uncharacterized protein
MRRFIQRINSRTLNITLFTLFTVFGFILPVIGMAFGLISYELRFQIFLVVGLLFGWFLIQTGVSRKDLGIRFDNLGKSLVNVSWSTLGAIQVMLVLYWLGIVGGGGDDLSFKFYLFYFFIFAPAQELIFRSVLFRVLEKIGIMGIDWKVVISSVLFSFMHIIYWDPVMMGVTLFMGIFWGYSYGKYPNLFTISLSHAVLGIVAMMLGVI